MYLQLVSCTLWIVLIWRIAACPCSPFRYTHMLGESVTAALSKLAEMRSGLTASCVVSKNLLNFPISSRSSEIEILDLTQHTPVKKLYFLSFCDILQVQ